MIARYWYRAFIVSLQILGLLLAVRSTPEAQAHEWYRDTTDPAVGGLCCGGHDCGPIPLDAEWVRPVPEGFHIVMTLEQTQTINPDSHFAIDAMCRCCRRCAILPFIISA